MSDQPLKDCPSCGEPKLEKLVSSAGFQLKGGGWYVTDFRDKKQTNAGKSNGDDNTATDKKTDSDTAKQDKTKKSSASGEANVNKV